MGIPEFFLIVAIGFSPSGASGVAMQTYEYKQPTMKACIEAKADILKQDAGRFFQHSLCVTRGVGK